MTKKITTILAAIAIGGLYAGGALAGAGHDAAKETVVKEIRGMAQDMKSSGANAHSEAFSFGQAGDAAKVNRTIDIEMMDNTFNFSTLDIKPGDVIRFNVKNMGEVVHEFNIAEASMHGEHQNAMMKMMESGAMEVDRINVKAMSSGEAAHDDPNSVLVEPGKTAELIWQFKKAANIEFACNVPGHYEDGMKGEILYKSN